MKQRTSGINSSMTTKNSTNKQFAVCMLICWYQSTRTGRGGKGYIYYKTFLIYTTCMRRARARPVRALLFSKLLHCCPRTEPVAMQRQMKCWTKAGQLNPQTLVGSLIARHGTSPSKSGKKLSLSAMTLRTQAASGCGK